MYIALTAIYLLSAEIRALMVSRFALLQSRHVSELIGKKSLQSFCPRVYVRHADILCVYRTFFLPLKSRTVPLRVDALLLRSRHTALTFAHACAFTTTLSLARYSAARSATISSRHFARGRTADINHDLH